MSRKQRYYMRGIGVGILVCALILIISRINTPADISDEEIVSRARALGMVDPGDLTLSTAEDIGSSDAASGTGANDANNDQNANAGDADAAGNTGDQNQNAGDTDSAGTTGDQNVNDGDTDATGATGDQNVNDGDTDATGATGEQNANATGTEVAGTDAADTIGDQSGETAQNVNSYAVLVVERGNSSDVVAARLQSLGVITDSRDFDKYLVDNGYASRISVGTFQIPYGSDYEYIAKAITRSL